MKLTTLVAIKSSIGGDVVMSLDFITEGNFLIVHF